MSKAEDQFEAKLTDLLIDKMKQMQLNYQDPWVKGSAVQNIQGRHYAGRNALLLHLATLSEKWEYPVFATFNMAKEEGLSILKGSKSLPALYYDNYYKNKEDRHMISIASYQSLSEAEKQKYEEVRFAKSSPVFNIAQTNIKEARPDLYEEIVSRYKGRDTSESKENKIDEVVRSKAWYCPIETDLSRGAFYDAKQNEIHITPKSRFVSDDLYHSTLLHEMTHSTGHPDLLDRLKPAKFGSSVYAREELVAELGSAIAGVHLELPVSLMEDHAAYLQSWIRALKQEPEFLHVVLADASKASNMIVSKTNELEVSASKQETETEKENETIGKETDMEPKEETTIKQESAEAPISVREEVLPYAELLAHRENMTNQYLAKLGEVPSSVRSTIDIRETILKDLEANTDKEREPELLDALMKAEDKIRTKVGEFVKEKYDFDLIPTPDTTEMHKAIGEMRDYVTEELSDQELLHKSLNDRLHITSYKDDTEKNRKDLERTDSEYEVTPDGKLKTKGVIRMQEGYTAQDTPMNRAFLQEKGITFVPIRESRLFIPQRAERVALLLVSSMAFTPVVALALMYALKRSKVLDQLDGENVCFSKEEAEKLNDLQTIRKTVEEEGRQVDKYYYLDPDTQRLRSIPVREVNLPGRVNGVQLSPSELQSLREGDRIQGYDENSKLYYEAQIDMRSKQGVKMSFKELKSEQEYKAIPTPNSPDAEKIDYVQKHGAQGVNDIWDKGGVNLERDSFLDKYDIEGSYKDYLKASQAGDRAEAEKHSNEIKDKMMSEEQTKSIHR